ncbi:SAP domain-containing protein [Streptomyces mirabilis]|uniref:SAP domain-containing protein n=1 Tax=Streptomyces mirabilis TaxID=68239 RepID=UPI0033C6059E
MDYEQMSTRELQEECRRRGLPSGRVKAELVQRLTDADAANAGSADDDFADSTTDSTDVADKTADPEPAQPASAPPVEPSPPGVFRLDFEAEAGGPDEESHLAYRQATLQAAVEAGYVPRGDAYRTGTVDGREVYEVATGGGDPT